jgi:hypothetical protein
VRIGKDPSHRVFELGVGREEVLNALSELRVA